MKNILHKAIIFPVLFFVKGLKIKNILNILAEYEANNYRNINIIQYGRLIKLLNIAKYRSGYYSKIFKENNIQLRDIKIIKDIARLPMLNKLNLRSMNPENIVTGNLRFAIKRRTAGTSGKPITVYMNKETLAWQLSTRYHFYKWHGIEVGDREARFWGRPVEGNLYKIEDYLLNRKRFNFLMRNKDETLREYHELINFKPDYIYGYSSLILNAAIFIDNNKLQKLNLKAIICTAESITTYQKQYIENIFHCPVVEEYGCSEIDIIAFECPNRRMHIATFRTILEITNNNEVVITDLNNVLMPIIRYNLEDCVEISDNKCSCGRDLLIINKVVGRTLDQLVRLENGAHYHAVTFAYMLEDIVDKGFELKQFKIIQCRNTIIFELDLDGDRDKFTRELSRKFNSIIEGKMNIKVEYKKIDTIKNKKYTYFEVRKI
jgi:phenylacetate-CoA ligase